MPHSASEQIHHELRAMILGGRLRTGQSLRAAALQEQFGFGLTPLREALNRLRSEQLVVAAHHQGFQVAPTSSEDLADLERTRGLIEGEMLIESMRAGDDAWEGAIVAAHYQLGKQTAPHHRASDDEIDRWDSRHAQFHEALLAGCRSRWLTHIAALLGAQLQRYHRNILRDVAELAASSPDLAREVDQTLSEVTGMDAHTRLMEKVLARAEAAASAELAAHVQLSLKAYLGFGRHLRAARAA